MKLLSIKRIMTLLFTTCIMLTLFFGVSPVVTKADDSVDLVKYTSVMEDLQKDENFDVLAYPAKDTDYSLNIIQIAESSDDELFIYVYNPSYNSKPLTATTIRFSTEINLSYHPLDYKLTLVSSHYMFQKYVVRDFQVKKDALRYYCFVCFHRAFDPDIDIPADDGQPIDEVACPIEQKWTGVTVNGVKSYNYEYIETITITDRYDGSIRMNNGSFLITKACDSHFVAFNTDRKMEELLEVDISYKLEKYSQYNNETPKLKSEEFIPNFTVTSQDKGSFTADRLFSKPTYKWDRISTSNKFLELDGIKFSDEARKNIENKSWVIQYTETEYSWISYDTGEGDHSTYSHWTEVKEVTIMRLMFRTEGKVYNLGVVDNKVSHDNIPEGTGNKNQDDSFNKILKLLLVLIIVGIGGALLAVLLPIIKPIFKAIFDVLWWIIAFPFNLLGKLFKKK